MKTWLGMQRFTSDPDLKTKVNAWFHKQDSSFYVRGIKLLLSLYEECTNINGDYVAKYIILKTEPRVWFLLSMLAVHEKKNNGNDF